MSDISIFYDNFNFKRQTSRKLNFYAVLEFFKDIGSFKYKFLYMPPDKKLISYFKNFIITKSTLSNRQNFTCAITIDTLQHLDTNIYIFITDNVELIPLYTLLISNQKHVVLLNARPSNFISNLEKRYPKNFTFIEIPESLLCPV